MAGKGKKWTTGDPACMLGLEWVCGIGETLAVRISIHYKIAVLSFILPTRAHATTKNSPHTK